MLYRQIHITDLSHRVAKFGLKTATRPLCCHLYENHTDAWIADCEQLRITIKSKEALDFIAEFCEAGPMGPDPNTCKPYLKEAFVDAIIEWIVGDDQVSVSIQQGTFLLIFNLVFEYY
jgi:hypothetical protein